METSKLPIKDFLFRPMLGTHGNLALMATLTRDIRLYGHLREPLTPVDERLAVVLSLLLILKTQIFRGRNQFPISRMQGEKPTPVKLRDRFDLYVE